MIRLDAGTFDMQPGTRSTILLGLALLFGLAACSSTSQRPSSATDVIGSLPGADTVAVRISFHAALAAVGPGSSMPTDPPALRNYAIYPYLAAARLQSGLRGQPAGAPAAELDARITAFLQAHRGEPVTRVLTHEWLVSLAMRQQWTTFLAHVSDFSWAADDPELVCAHLGARLATETMDGGSVRVAGAEGDGAAASRDDLAAAVLAVWNQPTEQPTACQAPFDWLLKRGLLTPARVAARARAALVAGHAELGLKLASQLPVAQAAPLVEWARLLRRPRAGLETLAQTSSMPVEADALTAAVERLALSDSATAERLLPVLLMRPGMTMQLSGQLQRSVALGLAYDHAPEAAAALEKLPEAARDDTVRVWGVRTALWRDDWPQTLAWLDQLSPVAAAEPRWLYWRARALAAVDGDTAAAPLFKQLAGLRDYYGYLAADRLALPYDLQAHPTAADLAMQSALAMTPGLVRAHELFECGLSDAAAYEWAVALHGATHAQRIQAAQLADHWGWNTQAIAQLGRADDLDDVALRYPRPYPDLVARASALTDVPADWVLAVMRQESLFRADAVSRANAQGLMQLLPTTASAVAYRWHVAFSGADALFDPATAVTLGAARLRELLNQYDGRIALALAAYNAGAGPIARWRPAQPMDADIWIENIAYGETRDYVERVLEHIVAFSWSRGALPPRLSSLLPVIGPDPSDASSRRRARASPDAG